MSAPMYPIGTVLKERGGKKYEVIGFEGSEEREEGFQGRYRLRPEAGSIVWISEVFVETKFYRVPLGRKLDL